jgi:hypothetical protein
MIADFLVGNAALDAVFAHSEETVFRLSSAYNVPVYTCIHAHTKFFNNP